VSDRLEKLLLAADRGEPIRVFHHHPCPDGFCAAYCAWTRLGDRAQYVPYDHASPPSPADFAGVHALMCDCCLARVPLAEAQRAALSLDVLDHHQSAADACFDLLPEGSFDMGRSGAAMAWDFFHPGRPRPLMVERIQERDLGLDGDPASRAFCRHLDAIEPSFAAWDRAASLAGSELAAFLELGAAMEVEFASQARAMAASARPAMAFGRRAMVANAPSSFASRIGSLLLADPLCEIALIWNSSDLRVAKLSLRSAPGRGPDVAALAATLGGGGHRHASGAFVPLASLPGLAPTGGWGPA
jgi:hypothetical protein